MRSGFEDWDLFLSMLERGLELRGDAGKGVVYVGITPEPLIEYRTAPVSSNVTSMTKRLDLIRSLIAKCRDLYAVHIVNATLGTETISMSRLTMWEPLIHGDIIASQTSVTHPICGDDGMTAAVRLQS